MSIVQSAEFKNVRILEARVIRYIFVKIVEVSRGIVER